MAWRLVGGMGVAAAALAGAPAAHAAESADGSPPGPFGELHAEVAGRVAYGPFSGGSGAFPLAGGGAGARGGLSYRGVYAGLTYMDYFTNGGCLDIGAPESCGSTHGQSFGLEGGYGHTFLGVLTLRGQMGVGDYLTTSAGTFVSGLAPPTTTHSSANAIYLQPGALLEVALGPVLVGADASVFYMPRPPLTNDGGAFAAFIFGLQLGVRM